MQGFDATFDDASFDGGRDSRKGLLPVGIGAVAAVFAGCVGAYLLRTPPSAAPHMDKTAVAEVAAKDFGEIVVEPGWAPNQTPASPDLSLASLEAAPPAAIPLPSLDAFPPAPAAAHPEPNLPAAIAQPDNVPLPPARDVPDTGESYPLPPSRPPEFGPSSPPAQERRVAQPGVAPAPADSRNFFQRLFGLGQPSSPLVARTSAVASRPTATSTPPFASPTSVASVAPEGRASARSFFGFGSFATAALRSSYDQYTAIYSISARAVFLPDGTRLEAHSGLGDKLDDPRFVSERARGATPPHLYELTLREASFHGVQALRLNPIGDGDVYGRDGLLAHPYMLGPNGESNGCVSVKDYDAFLRAYQNGQIRRLAVVAQL
jgi:hypothetical protein